METPTEKEQDDETKSGLGTTDRQNELELGSEDIEQPSCDPCGNEGTDIPAEGYCKTCGDYLCNQCFSIHCKPKPMRHHVLLGLQDMLKSESSTEQKEDCSEKCRHHVEMPLKVFCRTHNDMGCILCLTSDHKTCGDVSFIQDVAKDISQGKEYIGFQQELKKLENNFNTQLDAAKSEFETVNEIHTAVKASNVIKDMSVVLEEYRCIDTKLDEARESRGRLVEEVASICKDSISELHQYMNDPMSDILRFVNMKRGQAKLCKMNKCLEKLNADISLSKEGFEHLKKGLKGSKEKVAECNSHIQGCLTTPEDVHAPKTSENEDKSFTSIEIISRYCCEVLAHDDDNDSVQSNKKDCRITGSTVLGDGRIALADFCNNMVKVYSPRNNRIDASTALSSSPFDVAEIDLERVAVTMPSSRLIMKLSVNGTELQCDSSMKTNGTCRGISTDKKVLYVSFDNPPKVEIMDMKGTVLKLIEKDGQSQQLFTSPWYLTFNSVNARIYVTDREKDTVTCIAADGTVVAVHKEQDLVRPYGMTVDKSGTMYVCARRTDRIFCLTPDFKRLAIIEDDKFLRKPESVTCWNKRDRLYVGLYRDDEMTVLDIRKS